MKHYGIFYSTDDIIEKDSLSSFLDGIIFVPNCFGHQFNNPGATCNDRIIGDFEIIFVIEGQSNITIGKNTYTCSKGDLILIPPFTKHKIQTPADNPHNNYWIHFDIYPYYKHDDFLSAMMQNGSHVSRVDCFDEAFNLYRFLENVAAVQNPGSYTFFKTILVQIITLVLKSTFKNSSACQDFKSAKNTSAGIVDRCTDFIQNNIANPIGIQDLCKELNISESHLYKTFMKVLKISPVHFINLYKIKRAEQMMKSTQLSIKEISNHLGFSSPYYFSNVFKKFYNMSPREYKERS